MRDARETAKLQFHGHHTYLRKDFQVLLAAKEGALGHTWQQRSKHFVNRSADFFFGKRNFALTKEINRIYDGVEAETRNSHSSYPFVWQPEIFLSRLVVSLLGKKCCLKMSIIAILRTTRTTFTEIVLIHLIFGTL